MVNYLSRWSMWSDLHLILYDRQLKVSLASPFHLAQRQFAICCQLSVTASLHFQISWQPTTTTTGKWMEEVPLSFLYHFISNNCYSRHHRNNKQKILRKCARRWMMRELRWKKLYGRKMWHHSSSISFTIYSERWDWGRFIYLRLYK